MSEEAHAGGLVGRGGALDEGAAGHAVVEPPDEVDAGQGVGGGIEQKGAA